VIIQDNLLVDAVAWALIHLSIGYLSTRIPLSRLDPLARLYRTREWERDGEIYQDVLHVRRWKDLVPSGAVLYGTYSVKHIHGSSRPDLERWLKESCRAEICHWLMIPPGLLFFFWNDLFIATAMVVYAVLNNVLPIVLQRYNRPRVLRLLDRVEAKQVEESSSPVGAEHQATLSGAQA